MGPGTAEQIFSFGIVAIYVMLKDIVCDEAWRPILRRHTSYFGDEDGFQGLLGHIGNDNPSSERLVVLAAEVNPGRPFGTYEYVDVEFRGLVVKMTNLDPARWISAREAL
ncbi:hypothetical protein BR93DRAFT_944662 [Coniochaeta sp. PMI_546]|nr:hypothetical protein BR93DRAFT_944662 [Coniochaeta sp. PMI_546]